MEIQTLDKSKSYDDGKIQFILRWSIYHYTIKNLVLF